MLHLRKAFLPTGPSKKQNAIIIHVLYDEENNSADFLSVDAHNTETGISTDITNAMQDNFEVQIKSMVAMTDWKNQIPKQ